MADERWRIPVDSNYAHALGVAIYCWAYADFTAERYGVKLADGPLANVLALMEQDLQAARPATVDGRQRLFANGKTMDLYQLEKIADAFAGRAIAIIYGTDVVEKGSRSDGPIDQFARSLASEAREDGQDNRNQA